MKWGMNKLPLQTRVQILSMLCEGSSMRSISRVCDVSINTVSKMLVDAGNACVRFHSKTVQNVKAKRIQCDEIWSFCYAKNRNVAAAKAAPAGAGDVWTWTALDSDSKLLVTWEIGGRDAFSAQVLMDDLQARLANRVQLTTDGHKVYLDAVAGAFADVGVDYAMLIKLYGEAPPDTERKYSPSECIGARKQRISGNPDMDHVSTSHTERHNLTMRMHMKRFARLGNAFSKKVDNHAHMVALYAVWYNFVKLHKAHKMTPAMAAGVTDTLYSMTDLAEMVDATLSKPGKRGPYKKSGALELLEVSPSGIALLSDNTLWQVSLNDLPIVGDWAWPTQIRINGARMVNLRDGGSVGVTPQKNSN